MFPRKNFKTRNQNSVFWDHFTAKYMTKHIAKKTLSQQMWQFFKTIIYYGFKTTKQKLSYFIDVNILLIFRNFVLVISILLLILLSYKTSRVICDPRCVNSDTCSVGFVYGDVDTWSWCNFCITMVFVFFAFIFML